MKKILPVFLCFTLMFLAWSFADNWEGGRKGINNPRFGMEHPSVQAKTGRYAYKFFKMIFLLIAIVNILLAVIVFKDLKENPHLSGIWLIVVLLCGVPAMIAYSVFRLKEKTK